MTRPRRFRLAVWMLALALPITGGQTAMSVESENTIKPPPETYEVPLRFARHDFGAACYNTLRCSVVYVNKEFTPFDVGRPSLAPSSTKYRGNWGTGYLGIRNFPSPAEVQWTSLDGVKHETKVDMARIFKDRLVWHKVPKADMMDFYRGPVAGEPGIFLEVNDSAINVYMHMFVPTKTDQTPGNKDSNFRDDWFLAWTHAY